MKKGLIFLILLMLLAACTLKSKKEASISKVESDEPSLESLERMRINNSDKVFYFYSYSGPMAWSGSITGRILIDSTEIFSWEKARDKFAPGYVSRVNLEENEMEMIEFIRDNSEVVNGGLYTKKCNGIDINYKQYFNPKGSSINFSYRYQNLVEVKDSIYFDKIYLGKYGFGLDIEGRIGFSKGNIFVAEDSLGYVTKIKFLVITQNSLWENLHNDDSSVVSQPFTGANEIDLPPLSKVYMFNLELEPDSLSRNQKISDYGVYKRIR